MINPDEKKIRVSVVIPAFHVENYVGKCLESLYQQTLRSDNFEVILIDDASTDNTLKIIKEYKKKRSNIKIIVNRNNKGPGLSRNLALDVAVGDFIYFLDSDDYIDPTTLEKTLMIAYDNNADVVISGHYRVNEEGEILQKGGMNGFPYNGKYNFLSKFVEGQMTSMDCNRLIKRSVINDNRIRFPSGLHEDMIFMLKVYFWANNITSSNDYFYYWVKRSVSITNTISSEHIEGQFAAFREREEFLRKETSLGFMRKFEPRLIKSTATLSSRLFKRVIAQSDNVSLLKCFYKEIVKIPNIKSVNEIVDSKDFIYKKFLDIVIESQTMEKGIKIFNNYYKGIHEEV